MDKKSTIGAVGASLAAAVVFAGTVAAGVSAQAPTTTAPSPAAQTTTQTTPAPKATTVPGENPKSGVPFPGGHEGFGRKGGFGGRDGFDGFPGGRGRFVPTADTANRQITNATSFLTLARSDLAYANGKMDTANIEKWLNSADALVKSAQSDVTGTKYESAGLNAEAAMGLIKAAEGQMAYTLGADKLPSASQRPAGRKGHVEGPANPTTITVTQAQASRILAQTYNNLVAKKALIKATGATPYLTDAQNAYKSAYDAYSAGKYNDAVSSARLAGQLAGVARTLQAAANAPATPDTAVPVPGPTF